MPCGTVELLILHAGWVHLNGCTNKNIDHIKLINKKVLFEGIKASFFALALADSSRAFRGLK